MAKLSRATLKEIVKECLLEIITEGATGSSSLHVEEVRKRKYASEKKQLQLEAAHRKRREALDNIKYDKALDQNVSVLTEDPLMASILKDTAHNSLQEQIDAERVPGMSQNYDDEMIPSDGGHLHESTDDFGEGAKNWALLAFADKKKI